jgi:hypothetical protein
MKMKQIRSILFNHGEAMTKDEKTRQFGESITHLTEGSLGKYDEEVYDVTFIKSGKLSLPYILFGLKDFYSPPLAMQISTTDQPLYPNRKTREMFQGSGNQEYPSCYLGEVEKTSLAAAWMFVCMTADGMIKEDSSYNDIKRMVRGLYTDSTGKLLPSTKLDLRSNYSTSISSANNLTPFSKTECRGMHRNSGESFRAKQVTWWIQQSKTYNSQHESNIISRRFSADALHQFWCSAYGFDLLGLSEYSTVKCSPRDGRLSDVRVRWVRDCVDNHIRYNLITVALLTKAKHYGSMYRAGMCYLQSQSGVSRYRKLIESSCDNQIMDAIDLLGSFVAQFAKSVKENLPNIYDYMIHEFMNPNINARPDGTGGICCEALVEYAFLRCNMSVTHTTHINGGDTKAVRLVFDVEDNLAGSGKRKHALVKKRYQRIGAPQNADKPCIATSVMQVTNAILEIPIKRARDGQGSDVVRRNIAREAINKRIHGTRFMVNYHEAVFDRIAMLLRMGKGGNGLMAPYANPNNHIEDAVTNLYRSRMNGGEYRHYTGIAKESMATYIDQDELGYINYQKYVLDKELHTSADYLDTVFRRGISWCGGIVTMAYSKPRRIADDIEVVDVLRIEDNEGDWNPSTKSILKEFDRSNGKFCGHSTTSRPRTVIRNPKTGFSLAFNIDGHRIKNNRSEECKAIVSSVLVDEFRKIQEDINAVRMLGAFTDFVEERTGKELGGTYEDRFNFDTHFSSKRIARIINDTSMPDSMVSTARKTISDFVRSIDGRIASKFDLNLIMNHIFNALGMNKLINQCNTMMLQHSYAKQDGQSISYMIVTTNGEERMTSIADKANAIIEEWTGGRFKFDITTTPAVLLTTSPDGSGLSSHIVECGTVCNAIRNVAEKINNDDKSDDRIESMLRNLEECVQSMCTTSDFASVIRKFPELAI